MVHQGFNSHALRAGRHSLIGAYYLVTVTTRNRYAFFHEFQYACLASKGFYHPRVKEQAKTLSFVVMPDHIHWLFELQGTLPEAVRRYKSHVSLAIGSRVWQDGYHDRTVRDEAALKSMARYIVANPLRARLVSDINQYPFWNAIWL